MSHNLTPFVLGVLRNFRKYIYIFISYIPMKNYEIYPNIYFMSHNQTPFCRVVKKGKAYKAQLYWNTKAALLIQIRFSTRLFCTNISLIFFRYFLITVSDWSHASNEILREHVKKNLHSFRLFLFQKHIFLYM